MIELQAIREARERIADVAVRTPLIRLRVDDGPAEIWCKLETLQPINSFKIRGAANAIRSAPAAERERGLLTASAGNMAQGVAWVARELGLPATIAVPEHAPEAKLAAIERLGGRVLRVPYEEWWQAIVTSRIEGVDGLFVHPVQDPAVMAGNGTIGLEILEDLPDPDAVVIPVGGGGLTVGIASRSRRCGLRPGSTRPSPRPAPPCTRRWPPASRPMCSTRRRSSTGRAAVACSTRCGRGCRRWSTTRSRCRWTTPAAAVRTLAERMRVIAEGAGALATAAALAGRAGTGKVVCIVSGGNMNLGMLAEILGGER